MISIWKYLSIVMAYFRGLISDRRFPVKVGAAGVFSIAGIGAFSDAYGLSGIIGYITSLAVLRVLFSIPVSLAVKRYPEATLKSYRWSPCLILLGTLSMLDGHLLLLPVCLALYISLFWVHYHSLREIRGKGTQDFVDVEVWASIIGTGLALIITHFFSIEIAGVVGGVLCFTGALKPLDVTAEELLDTLAVWEKEASSRSPSEIANGARIARAIGTIGFCSLSLLRITILDTPDLFDGVLSLGLVVICCEFVVWAFQGLRKCFSGKAKGEQGRRYGSPNEMAIGFIITVVGFALMGFYSSDVIFGTGYTLVSIVARSVNRDVDQEFARSNLRGLRGNPASRELEKFCTWLVLCPLLLVPFTLVPVGIFGAIMLLNSSFTHPRDRGK